ncbi:Small glutamine-rich tetratricopeptide repeat-containing protein 2 [Coemansia erecta]|uniref:Small glutamine-rich tetratricopeptide repeat-containing protein 2 n=1 Tax=Coemansia asiatica TaxID=1052880 RepID=A0A9W7XI19_9FUNG|nr:Small glutamine-rich tetratricopeptide repeat-containing protein 2 [Coemansia asiatica]KAJ2853751.1 Small glutamine-rich tetratricopeptide repeat-containing protein 2 [Coemansia erecta]
MSESEHNRKRLAMGIVEYLEKAVSEGTVSGDGAESLEIAKQCIADAFEINPEDEAQVKELSLKPYSLDKVFDVYLNAQAKMGSAKAESTTEGAASTSAAAAAGPSEDDRKCAEELKAEGNALVAKKEYVAAIDAYTKAIELVKDNAVYYGNRAAAYSQNGDHAEAVDDAKKALEIDPSYVRGYSRLGRAYFGLGEFKLAAEAYEKGLQMDPENSVMKSSLESVKARLGSSADASRSAASTSGEAGSGSNAGAGAGAGGFDLGSMLNNPALMSMAQNMMANGGLERFMSNPAISQLANNYRSSGQMPSMSDLMNNPDLANLARDFSGMAGSSNSAGDQSAQSSGSNSSGSGAAGSNPMASLLNNPALMNMAQQFMRGNNNNNNNNNSNNSSN